MKSSLQTFLKNNNACPEAIEWAKSLSWEQAYKTCPRGDWLLWVFARMEGTDRKLLVLSACDCAALSLKFIKDKKAKKIAEECLKVTRAWTRGKASLEEVKKAAASAASAAYAASAASASAAYAASAAASAASAAYAASAAACADAYADAMLLERKKKMDQKTADVVRKTLKFALVV